MWTVLLGPVDRPLGEEVGQVSGCRAAPGRAPRCAHCSQVSPVGCRPVVGVAVGRRGSGSSTSDVAAFSTTMRRTSRAQVGSPGACHSADVPRSSVVPLEPMHRARSSVAARHPRRAPVAPATGGPVASEVTTKRTAVGSSSVASAEVGDLQAHPAARSVAGLRGGAGRRGRCPGCRPPPGAREVRRRGRGRSGRRRPRGAAAGRRSGRDRAASRARDICCGQPLGAAVAGRRRGGCGSSPGPGGRWPRRLRPGARGTARSERSSGSTRWMRRSTRSSPRPCTGTICGPRRSTIPWPAPQCRNARAREARKTLGSSTWSSRARPLASGAGWAPR